MMNTFQDFQHWWKNKNQLPTNLSTQAINFIIHESISLYIWIWSLKNILNKQPVWVLHAMTRQLLIFWFKAQGRLSMFMFIFSSFDGYHCHKLHNTFVLKDTFIEETSKNPSLFNCGLLFRGFIKGWAPGKLTPCKDNFAYPVWPSRVKFFLQRISVQKVLLACENQLTFCCKP